MTSLLIALALALSLLLSRSSGLQPVPATEDLCAGWAIDMQAEPDDYRMHAMGCAAPWGTWQRSEGRCMQIAYAVSRKHFSYAAIGQYGCVLYEDGSWGTE